MGNSVADMTTDNESNQIANDAQPGAKPRRNLNQHTVNLTPELIANLDRLASRLGCVAMTGPKAGSPSWRSMLRFVAMGFLAVHRPGQTSIVVGGDEVGQSSKKADKDKPKTFRCHPGSPPKFWPSDTGCLARAEFETKTKLSEDELIQIGFSLTARGTLWRAPRNWPAWNPMSPVPDWWDDTDGSGAMMLDEVPDGVDVMADERLAVSGGMVWPNQRRGK